KDIWQLSLNRFFKVIDEEAIFTTEFKDAWQIFISKYLLKIIKELLDGEKKLIKIKDLDCITLDYDIYDAEDVLNLNNPDFKALLKKELNKKGRSK
ncbi:20453_t:CDS:1, partial [Dentiscutata erythropus]